MTDLEDNHSALELPEPYTIGDPGRSYHEIRGGAPSLRKVPNDTVCDGFDFAGWSVRAASVRGLTHRYGSTPRQDAFAVRYCSDRQRLVLVVCDGVGAGAQSHRAAEVAADCLADLMVDGEQSDREQSDGDWTPLFTIASDAVLCAAAELGGIEPTVDAVRSVMATTATVVIIDGVGTAGSWTVRTATVGDSGVWVADRAADGAGFGAWTRLVGGKVTDDGPATTTTSALPLRDCGRVLANPLTLGADQLLLVCTDGIGDPFANGSGQVAKSLGAEWSTPPTPLNFAAQVSFGRRSHTDDRTGVAVWTPRR